MGHIWNLINNLIFDCGGGDVNGNGGNVSDQWDSHK